MRMYCDISHFPTHLFSLLLGVDSDAANQVMDTIRESFVNGDTSSMEAGESGIKLIDAVEFRYVAMTLF